MNGIQKVVDELEAFEQSIRHLPLAERKRLREREYQRRSKASETGRKIAYVGAVAFIPAVVWSGLCFYTDTVLEHFQSCIGLMMLAPVAMLLTEYYLRRKYG
ncbi:hypothetical protein R3112_004281 [Escherichia coli]|nr:hypothetical protein [Escherichia coli]MGE31025.1 hypothetical protein [Escherichia coli]HDL8517137.1 hypothetical protein [Yersinia enterocolitica]HDL8557835.1 hypothetical protein [Yersinia enterocolitica]